LNGSVATVTQNYWITSVKNQTDNYWDDISTVGLRQRKQINQEWAVFVKDDFKISRRLTLNLGVRWEYYSSPYIDGGFTTSMPGYGWGAFGATPRPKPHSISSTKIRSASSIILETCTCRAMDPRRAIH